MSSMLKPRVAVTGSHGRSPGQGWGRHEFPVQAGSCTVQVDIPKRVRKLGTPPNYGEASVAVDVRPGQTVELEYAAPMVYTKGALGAGPQEHRGMVAMWTWIIVTIALIAGALGAAVLLAPYVVV